MSTELFKGYGIPVVLKDEESFSIVKETLSRIGVASKKEKVLWPSCHLLHKRGYYHIMHFKEMFLLDGRPSDLSENDIARRNTIALLLEDWGLCKIQDKQTITEKVVDMNQIKVLNHKEKIDWEIKPKYSMGTKKI